jgi:chondroitin 4-sulfotransferase 11
MNQIQYIFLEKYKALFIPIPKVASSSFKFLFANMLNLEIPDSVHKIEFPSYDFSADRSDIFKFTFVRNPWDRLVSCYFDKIKNETNTGDTYFTYKEGVANCLASFDEFTKDMTFSEFVNVISKIPDEQSDPHFKSQSSCISKISDLSFVGKLENLDIDLSIISSELKIPVLKLAKIKTTIAKNYRDLYNEETKKIVYRRYENDIEEFKYVF